MEIKLNGKPYPVSSGQTILEVARENGVYIPTLCFLKDCQNTGHCGICKVEVEGLDDLVGACRTEVEDGMVVRTNNRRVQTAAHERVGELLSSHNFSCGTCERKADCEFLKLVRCTYAKKSEESRHRKQEGKLDDRSASIVRDESKCLHCNRCVSACRVRSGTEVMQFNGDEEIAAPSDLKCFDETGCILCGQCVVACPVGALSEKNHIGRVRRALSDPSKHVIVGMAPSIRTAVGEAFGMEYGTDVTKKIYAALRRLGFAKVFDVNFAADMTILEEGTELLERIQRKGPFPMYTSCCPAWIRLAQHYYPELLPNISSAKSPQQMFGAVSKSYYASESGVEGRDIFTVTVMPCTAKKFEADRDEMVDEGGIRDVDAVLDTREFIRIIRENGIDFAKLPDEECDSLMGYYTGAGTIFGATGGVMEAALRTAKDLAEHVSLETVEYQAVRGLEGIKEAVVPIAGAEYRVAVIHGAANLFRFMESGLLKEKDYHFIEVMSCPGGCVNGGGQPHVNAVAQEEMDIRKVRASVLYQQDKQGTVYRKSHQNPVLLRMYDTYMGDIGGARAHELLHVHYKSNTSKGGYHELPINN